MIAVYTKYISRRIQYTATTLFDGEVTLYDNKDVFQNCGYIKINYSNENIPGSFRIGCIGFLTETGIKKQDLEVFEWNELPVFFRSEGNLPFDIFAASFYLISRYEEYLPHSTDGHGRYPHQDSLAYKHGFIKIPLIDLWMAHLSKLIADFFPGAIFPVRAFQYIPTYDIDIAYSFSNHSAVRNSVGFVKDIIQLRLKNLISRFETLFLSKPDPFDAFAYLNNLHNRFGIDPVYFFLVAEKRKGFDKNISPSSAAMTRLIQETSGKYQTGIHPSWQSGDSEALLRREIAIMKRITGKATTLSRQHYLRFTLPSTYQKLERNRITEEYSMGYATINGFRASCSRPFLWYDLAQERISSLKVRPFCFMDATSIFKQKDDPKEALNELQSFHDIIRSVDGELITIFHNHFLTNDEDGRMWRAMYEEFLSANFGSIPFAEAEINEIHTKNCNERSG